MSELLALGISHKTAPVEIRERARARRAECRAPAARAHRARRGPRGRRDLDVQPHRGLPRRRATRCRPRPTCLSRLANRAGIRPTELAHVVYTPRNCDAARQLYRVASGLESMIVGEAEIQGQVRRAHELALAAGTTGPMTNRLFQAALEAGKRVRTADRDRPRARERLDRRRRARARDRRRPAERSVIVIGAGETSERTAQALADQGVTTIFIANRHADRARALAERFGGIVGSLDALPERLLEADIVVASTSSPHAAHRRRGARARHAGPRRGAR